MAETPRRIAEFMTENSKNPTADDQGQPHQDQLPEELDVTALVGPYVFPDIRRRRIAATLYAVIAFGCSFGWVISKNGGLAAAAVALGLIAAYHVACAWPLRVKEMDALVAAGTSVDFPVGHASAQLAWRGLRSRPTWRLLLYSAEDPPKKRGLVELDAVTGEVLHATTHDNPEDWSGS